MARHFPGSLSGSVLDAAGMSRSKVSIGMQ
jgi:hypothetical protein